MKELDLSIKIADLTAAGDEFSTRNPAFFKILSQAICKTVPGSLSRAGIGPDNIRILRRSLDFRKGREPALDLRVRVGKDANEKPEQFVPAPESEAAVNSNRPVVVGFGPAGIFCALTLARAGLRPAVIERGEDIDRRTGKVERFWNGSDVDPESNVQFGEGGAGAYSDGKLTTLVKERNELGKKVLETFVEFGAPEDILIDSHPHIGTDILRSVVKAIRLEIIKLGGTVYFSTKFTGIERSGGAVCGAVCESGGKSFTVETCALFLAIGHSARDTFEMLSGSGITMTPKPSSVGVRIEHPQKLINNSQYGQYSGFLSRRYPAIYKLSHRCSSVAQGDPDGEEPRGVYTFCMCPGGYVVNSSFEPGGIVTNGMSYSKRDGANANSAVLVSVRPSDYAGSSRFPADPLCGMYYQRDIERRAFTAGGSGAMPASRLSEFVSNIEKRPGFEAVTQALRKPQPQNINGFFDKFAACSKGTVAFADITDIFPEYVTKGLAEGIAAFDRIIPGFAHSEAILTAPETLSSSPVRIERDPETAQSVCLKGLYPVGEGAGYAGGITSSGIDGIKAALKYISL